MNRNDRVNAILDRQQAGIEAILAASRQLLDERNSFSIESLDALEEPLERIRICSFPPRNVA